MSSRFGFIFVVILGFLLSSCGPSIAQTVRIHPQPPNDEDCGVIFDTSSITNPNPFPGYRHIGAVHVQRPPFHWTAELDTLMIPKVCEMGGDLASIVSVAAAEGKDTGVVTIYIFRQQEDSESDPGIQASIR